MASCFFGHRTTAEKRPDAPFRRTELSLSIGTNGKVLRRDRVDLPSRKVEQYLFFDHGGEPIGAYPLALHHSIPFNLIKSSWDPIILFCTNEAIVALGNHYGHDHPSAALDRANYESYARKVLAIRKAHGPDFSNRALALRTHEAFMTAAYAAVLQDNSAGAITREEADLAEVILCWGGWNLTEGPVGEIRTEDPGEAFDDFEPCAQIETQKARYRAVARLNATLLGISTEYEGIKKTPISEAKAAEWSDQLLEALRVCAAMTAEQRKLINLDPQMWQPVGVGGPVARKPASGLKHYEIIKKLKDSKTYFAQMKCRR